MPLPHDSDLIFFIHVMKTGGTSVDFAIRSAISKDGFYPDGLRRATMGRYFDIERLRRLSARDRAKIRYLRGHFPFCVSELFNQRVRHVAFFREPVSRTLSHLIMRGKHKRFRGYSLTELYDREDTLTLFMSNLQCRYFSLDLTPDLSTIFVPRRLTRDDLQRAKQRVARCEFVGLQEDFRNSLTMLGQTLGLRLEGCPRTNVGEPVEIPAGLPERIAEDNAIDIEFYQFVRDLYYKRRQAALAPAA